MPTTFTLAFQIKPHTRDKLWNWYNGAPSQYGQFTIDQYRTLISSSPYNIVKQTWYLEPTDTGSDILMVVSEFLDGTDPAAARNLFIRAGGRFEQWCVAQLNAQKDSGGKPTNDVVPDVLQILPYP